MSVQVSPVLAALSAAVDAVAGSDVRDVPEVDRLAEQQLLMECITRLRAVEVARLRVLEVADTTTVETGRATRSWLIEEALVAAGEATKRLQLGRALLLCPLVEAAFGAGELSFDHAVVITRACLAVPEEFRGIVEQALVELSQQCPPHQLGGHIETLLVACGVEPSSDEAHVKRLARRGLRIASTLDGMRAVSGMLTPEVAEALQAALAVLSQPVGDDDERSVEQRQHDAVGDLARHYLGNADLPAVHGERPRIVVTIYYDALIGALAERERDLAALWGRLPSGATIAPATARWLACDAEIIPVVLGARSEVLDVGALSRSFSTAVRRAAWLEQSGRCAFPRCTRPPVDCHHIVWWTHGGRSTLDNAAWVCSYHHWLLHEGSWAMRRDNDRGFVFTGPRGQVRRRQPEAA